jgi:hypothetical protein
MNGEFCAWGSQFGDGELIGPSLCRSPAEARLASALAYVSTHSCWFGVVPAGFLNQDFIISMERASKQPKEITFSTHVQLMKVLWALTTQPNFARRAQVVKVRGPRDVDLSRTVRQSNRSNA